MLSDISEPFNIHIICSHGCMSYSGVNKIERKKERELSRVGGG